MVERSSGPRERSRLVQYRPVWITLILLAGSLYLTTRYYKGIENPELFPSNILVITLVNVNLILVILLTLLLSRNLLKAYFGRRLRILGSGFRTKLIAAFVGLSLVPSILLFVVASGLLTSSIENWFSIQVEESLESSLKIAQDTHQQMKESSLHYAREAGIAISRDASLQDPARLRAFLEQKLNEWQIAGIEIYRAPAQEVISVTAAEFGNTPFLSPSPDLLKDALGGQEVVQELSIARDGDRGLLMRGMVALPSSGRPGLFVVVVDRYLSGTLLKQMGKITQTFEEYKQLKTFKNPIKGSYILSILIVTLLIIFSATWFGFYIAKGITIPIQKLAEGTQALAQGNLDFRIDVKASDEIGVLVRSFNKMTEDLKGGKTELEEANFSLLKSNMELEHRRAYIESILDNITTGVISIGPEGQVTTLNHAAEAILNIRSDDLKGKHYTDAFKNNNLEPFTELMNQLDQKPFLDKQMEMYVKGNWLTLRLHLSRLQEENSRPMGSIIVFDDLSELIKAQKVATWQEVAQRIAHEIKNPLTPIQLSAQRLRKKYTEDPEGFHAIFDESTRIIIGEVTSLKTRVDEFSNFARMPPPQTPAHRPA